MRTVTSLTIVMLLALGGACSQKHDEQASQPAAASSPAASQPAQATQASVELSPEQLGELGAQIQKTPDRANDLLTQHGLTQKSFEAQIRKVTESPDASKRYATAYRKARA